MRTIPSILALMLLLGAPASAQVTGAGRPGAPPPPPPPTMPGADPKLATGTASIKGRVMAADTGSPLRRAQVRVSAPELGATGRSVGTDIDGYYEVAELPAGRYTVNVSRGGYLSMQYGQRRFGESGAPLQAADGQVHAEIDFALARASTISGRVVDESGQPVGAAAMYAMQWQYFQGRRQLVPIGGGIGTRSDDTGHYRIQGVPPGDYYVMANSREMWASDEDPDVTFGFSPSYYPGVAAPGEAQRVRLGVAENLSTVDFNLVPVRASTLSGIALGLDGSPLGAASVSLSQEVRGPSSMSMSAIASTRSAADGSLVNEQGQAADGTVLFFPTDPAKWHESAGALRHARADQNGRFRFATVRPGEYFVIALDYVQAWQVSDPQFLESLRRRATKIQVIDGENEPLTLRIVR